MSSVQLLLDRVRLDEKQKLDELCQWLLQHLHECIGWSVLVDRSKMSNEELIHLFMLHHDMSPIQWITHQREKLMIAPKTNRVDHLDLMPLHG